MADQNQAKAAAEAPAKVAEAIADTAQTVADESAKTARRARAASVRRAKRDAGAAAAPAARKSRKTRADKGAPRTRRSASRTAARQAETATQQGNNSVNANTNFFAALSGAPALAPFQSLFSDAGDRSQQAVRRSQQVAEDFAELTRANMEAMVEATRVAAQGARSIGQDVVTHSRDSVEQTAEAIRTLAEAKSPTEFVQRQSELARASFDRMVADSSRLTESMVKLAGEAIQPLSNRATVNAERMNNYVA